MVELQNRKKHDDSTNSRRMRKWWEKRDSLAEWGSKEITPSEVL
jgi:hypothetical protein